MPSFQPSTSLTDHDDARMNAPAAQIRESTPEVSDAGGRDDCAQMIRRLPHQSMTAPESEQVTTFHIALSLCEAMKTDAPVAMLTAAIHGLPAKPTKVAIVVCISLQMVVLLGHV